MPIPSQAVSRNPGCHNLLFGSIPVGSRRLDSLGDPTLAEADTLPREHCQVSVSTCNGTSIHGRKETT